MSPNPMGAQQAENMHTMFAFPTPRPCFSICIVSTGNTLTAIVKQQEVYECTPSQQTDKYGPCGRQGAGAEVQRPVYQMHAYPPGVDPPSTDNTPWGVALGQTLATPRMPDPQTSPPAPGPGHGWVQGVPGSGDAHASNSPSPAGEACLTTPTDLLLQVLLSQSCSQY